MISRGLQFWILVQDVKKIQNLGNNNIRKCILNDRNNHAIVILLKKISQRYF